jgi:hypothetical protein
MQKYSKVPCVKTRVMTEDILDIPEANLNSIVMKARLPSEKQIIVHKMLLHSAKLEVPEQLYERNIGLKLF